jgi:hypothetical protein
MVFSQAARAWDSPRTLRTEEVKNAVFCSSDEKFLFVVKCLKLPMQAPHVTLDSLSVSPAERGRCDASEAEKAGVRVLKNVP